MNHMYHVCQQNLGKFVAAQTTNNEQIQGYVENVDENNVYMIVPEYDENEMMYHQMGPVMSENMGNPGHGCGCYPKYDRQFYGYDGYGFGGYPGGGYYYPRPHFSRLVLPLAALVALSTLY